MKTNWQDWFCTQLQMTADGLVWAVEQFSDQAVSDWQAALDFFETQPPAWHLWHVTRYEQHLALPAMKVWLGAPLPPVDDWEAEDRQDDEDRDWDLLIREFRSVRSQEMALLGEFTTRDWEQCRPVFWGVESLSSVLTRTYQHTLAHTETLLRVSLWSRMTNKREMIR